MTAWNLSRPDWRERIAAGRSLLPDMPHLDKARAARAIGVYDRLRIPDIPGQPTFGEAGADWFREIIGALNGALIGGTRMIEQVFLLVPKKNAKTTNGAALMLTALLLNTRPRADFLLVAATQHIAETAFSQIEGMIEADPVLKAMLHVQPHLKKITHRRSRAKLQIKSFDPKVVTGVKPSGVLVDELHLLGEMPNADRVIGQLRGGLVSQPEGFLAFITTQSERPPAGVFRDELAKARAIRDGRAAGTMLPVLYEFPEPIVDQKPGELPTWHDTGLWPMVTPNRGKSITIDRLAADFSEARLAGEAEIRRWASQHLNVEIGLALRSDRWVGADYWQNAALAGGLSLDDLIARSDIAVVGADGGGLDDLFGLAVIGRERVTRRWLLWTHAWAHADVLTRRKSEAARLRDFAAAGDLTIYEVMGADVGQAVDVIEQLQDAGLLPEKNGVGVDLAGISDLIDELEKREIDTGEGGLVVGIPQGWKLTNAIKTAERRLAGGELVHGGQTLMAWCVGNARVEPRGNAILITKQASGTAKIDPLMATFDAVSLMALNPEAAGGSFWDH